MSFDKDILEHHRFLLRLAVLQLGSSAEAEDVVQETFVSAVAGLASFSGKVPIKAWLVGILRHKIIDCIRIRTRYISLDHFSNLDDDTSDFDTMFSESNAWRPEALAGGTCPESAMRCGQLLELLEFCMEKLPKNTAKVFLMREFLEIEFSEIAKQLSLSEGNIRVLLYRARMCLRDCVSHSWGA